jgi:hypothetical protein
MSELKQNSKVTVTRGKYRGKQATVIEVTPDGENAAIRLEAGALATVAVKSLRAPEAKRWTEDELADLAGEMERQYADTPEAKSALREFMGRLGIPHDRTDARRED